MTRRGGLMLALAASLAATGWAALSGEVEEGATAPVVRKSAQPMAAVASSWPAPLSSQPREDWPAPEPQVRAAWGVESASNNAVAKAAPQAAPALQPPPLSYQVLGRMDDERPRAIFSNALRTEVLGVGDVLDRQWRIEAIDPQGVQLAWLRGDQKRTLAYPTP